MPRNAISDLVGRVVLNGDNVDEALSGSVEGHRRHHERAKHRRSAAAQEVTFRAANCHECRDAGYAHHGQCSSASYALLGLVADCTDCARLLCGDCLPACLGDLSLACFQIFTPTLRGQLGRAGRITSKLLGTGEFWSSLWNNIIWTVGTLTAADYLAVSVWRWCCTRISGLPQPCQVIDSFSLLRFDGRCSPGLEMALQ